MIVIPAKAGIQKRLKRLDSRLHGNDGICKISTFYEIIIFSHEGTPCIRVSTHNRWVQAKARRKALIPGF